MATISAERPQFFEGQYLGADDLAAIVEYLRTTTARQNLGQHSWGIAIGLNLVSQAVTDTAVEYYVQPGVAVDGYGRLIVVTSPVRIEADLFTSIGSGNVDVWIRYDQSELSAVRPGFNTCATQDEYARISESYKIVVGGKPNILDRQSGVTVNDNLLVDAREALSSVDPAAELLCDAAVPHQQFPIDDANDYWLVPLGHVKWSAASGSFLPLVDPAEAQALQNGNGDPDQVYESLMASRAKRRLIGTVSESIFAAEGLIRLRERTVTPDPVNGNDAACSALKIDSIDMQACGGRVKPKELVWLEGNTRVTGDMRLLDGRLEFKNSSGRDYIQRHVAGNDVDPINPLLIQRKERDQNQDQTKGSDLQIMLGDMGAAAEKRNRLVVGSILFDGDNICSMSATDQGKVFFEDNGRVGIGTYSPETLLTSPLTIRGLEEALDVGEGQDPASVMQLINFEGQGGDVKWQISLGTDFESLSFNEGDPQTSRLFLQAGGNVGIDTAAPQAKLDVAQVPTTNGGSPLGTDLWFRLGQGGDNGRVWVEYGSQKAPLLVLSDMDDPPRIQFQQTNSAAPDNDSSPAFSSWIGHAAGKSSNLAVMGGLLGVGTESPMTTLHVATGKDVNLNDDAGFLMLGDVNGLNVVMDNNEIQARNNGAVSQLYLQVEGGEFSVHWGDSTEFRITHSGDVGIGTNIPAEKLDVRGNVKLGGAGELFAMGGVENLRTIVGRVSSGGAVMQGAGYTVGKGGDGEYTLNFNPPFASDPVVVATMYAEDEHIVSVMSVTNASAHVRSRDMFGGNAGDLQNAAFTFIAIGER